MQQIFYFCVAFSNVFSQMKSYFIGITRKSGWNNQNSGVNVENGK